MGVLGALAFTPEQLEIELQWLDEHVDGKPYGVDVVMPASYAGSGGRARPVAHGAAARRHDPPGAQGLHREGPRRAPRPAAERGRRAQRAARLDPRGRAAPGRHLARAPDQAARQRARPAAEGRGRPGARARREGRGAGREPRPRRAAGEPGRRHDRRPGLRSGRAHGRRRRHGARARGRRRRRDRVPVLAAGGIGSGRQMAAAMALGADGVWTGSIWLTTSESDTAPVVMDRLIAAGSRDTVRSRVLTGKPARQLRTPWTEAWERDDSPGYLPMPLQYMATAEAQRRVAKYQVDELRVMPGRSDRRADALGPAGPRRRARPHGRVHRRDAAARHAPRRGVARARGAGARRSRHRGAVGADPVPPHTPRRRLSAPPRVRVAAAGRASRARRRPTPTGSSASSRPSASPSTWSGTTGAGS